MQQLFIYLLKLSISLSAVYLFYYCILRKLTFYNSNRWYLFGYSLLSFFIAIYNVTPFFHHHLVSYKKALQLVPAISNEHNFFSPSPNKGMVASAWIKSVSYQYWLLFIVLAGVVVLCTRLIIQYVSFLQIRSRAILFANNETKMYDVNDNISPFSFGNSIFVNRRLHSVDELQEIIRHEFVHVKQKHNIDIIWSEVLCILNWYNPFVWLLRRAIRQNLEFIADNKVLNNGVDRKRYQYLLLKVIGNRQFSIASNFNFSSLKKRIAMMNKIKSARIHVVKFLFILPLAMLLLVAFRNSEIKRDAAEARHLTVKPLLMTTNVPVSVIDTIPVKARHTVTIDKGRDSIVITDAKASVHLRNGKKEEFDLTDSIQRSAFEKDYGPVIMTTADGEDAEPVSIATDEGTTTVITSVNKKVSVATAISPSVSQSVSVSANDAVSPVITTGTSSSISLDETPEVVVDESDDSNPSNDLIYMLITPSTTQKQLDDFVKDAKSKDIALNYDKIRFNTKGELIDVVGTLTAKSGEHCHFTGTRFDKLIVRLPQHWGTNSVKVIETKPRKQVI